MKKLVFGDKFIQTGYSVCNFCGEFGKCFLSNDIQYTSAEYVGARWMMGMDDCPSSSYGFFGYNGRKLKRMLSPKSYFKPKKKILRACICKNCAKQMGESK